MQGSTGDTKERILDATKRLFFEKGIEGISMRAVTAEAGVNIAAVNYHFGSKDALLGAMARRFLDDVNVEQLRLLSEIEEQTNKPTVEDILIAYALPIFKLFDTYRGKDWGQAWMYARMGGPERPAHDMLKGMHPINLSEVSSVTRQYCEALQRAIPHIPMPELLWRFGRASNLLMANQGKRTITNPALGIPDKGPQDERLWLITFLAGGLQAPATDQTKLRERMTPLN